MYEKLTGIVLNTIKYNDKHNIAHVYTRQRGLMSFLVRQGYTRTARARNAMFMPLSAVSFEARVIPGKDLSAPHDIRRSYPLSDIYANPVKSAVTLFVSEVLTHVIQEREANEPLYRYIESSVLLLERMRQGVANFHICFLYHLGEFLGVQPDVSTYTDRAWFDMDNGVFTSVAAGGAHLLRPDDAQVIMLLSRMTFRNLHVFRFNHNERNQILDTIIRYFRIHHSALGTLRSPEILKQLFV